jgi:hypothetical protein
VKVPPPLGAHEASARDEAQDSAGWNRRACVGDNERAAQACAEILRRSVGSVRLQLRESGPHGGVEGVGRAQNRARFSGEGEGEVPEVDMSGRCPAAGRKRWGKTQSQPERLVRLVAEGRAVEGHIAASRYALSVPCTFLYMAEYILWLVATIAMNV